MPMLRARFFRSTVLLVFYALCGSFSFPARADSVAPLTFNRPLAAIRLPKEATPPAIDGDLSDPVWQRAAKAVTFFDPQSGKPVADQTEAFLIYDKDHIYIAFHCRDSAPDSIVARETIRDAPLYYDDHVLVEFDPFLTYKWNDCARFYVNARGTQRSQLSGGRANKLEWQGDWKAAARRVADGWTAEMSIPWGILSYPRSAGSLNMGINFRRHQQRTMIESFWSDLGPQFFNEREGIWQGVQAPVTSWKPRFSLLPYLMPSVLRGKGRSQAQFGLDGRYQPTPELTGVFTYNPDFTSVEGAVEGINFSRSERFVPDRRPFFLEGRDYMELGAGYQVGLLFNSARIRAVDTGLKLYGKLNPQTTLGALGTVAFGQEANFVTQVRRELGPTSNARVMLLQRFAPGENNTVLVFAPQFRRGKWQADAQLIPTFGQGAGGMGWTLGANLQDKNFYAALRYMNVPGNFQARLGFIPFTDYHGVAPYLFWGTQWRRGFFRSFDMSFYPTWDWHLDGRPFRRRAGWDLYFETRNDYGFGVSVEGGKFDNDTDFTYGFNFGGNVSNRFRRWNLNFTTGQQANRPYTSFGPSFNVRLFKRFDMGVGSFVQNYEGFAQQHVITLNYELSPFRSWGGRAVIENGKVNLYLSFRSSGRGGTDTYFILGDPNSDRITQRAMLKFVFAL